ncbi:GH1 family beta-glucosidase [Cerasicoccus maritimus]|uniref:GH1 family beta-glucosidase n=1 Tax=Cerasicoccus maritimus TaxID=490089 RepID=UPI0028528069|nr:GH1 family beta-glucosidase [Cerasicoccus maritimus]
MDTRNNNDTFPNEFLWGAAAASYQIEGAWNADGKGLSVWDVFSQNDKNCWLGHNGNDACDHYNRYKGDVELMREIGLGAYRMSISWPRVIPDGTGTINKAGLGFYDRLVDTLLAANIEPWVTLYHWDMPYALDLKGGWLSAQSPEWFAEYTQVIVDALSDRVSHWITLNEPQCFLGLGYGNGSHAPGMKLEMGKVLQAGHNALLAHGRATQVIRARAKIPAKVGWAPVGVCYFPATDSEADRQAAYAAMSGVYADSNFNNRWWGDPVVHGQYPEEGLRAYGKSCPRVEPGDFDIIQQPIDFYGCNIYHGMAIKAGEDGRPKPVAPHHGFPHTHMLWKVSPDAMYWGTKFLYEQYQLPVYITENGISCHDWMSLDGQVHDPQRIDYMQRYLKSLKRSIDDGVDVRGYFHWSIMDNFEWAEGYKQRFGLIYVDYETQERTLKDSALYYREIIASNSVCSPSSIGNMDYITA